MADDEVKDNKVEEHVVDDKIANITGGHGHEDEKIDKLDLSQFAPQARSRFEEIKTTLTENLKSLGSSDLADRDNVISHVGEALQDIHELEAKAKASLDEVDQELLKLSPKIDNFHQEIVRNKGMSEDTMYAFIEKFVELSGPNRDTTALFLSLEYSPENYIANHTLNVILLSLSLAMELSKIMEKKLTLPAITNDLKKVMICNRKIFTKKELIQIGMTAFLHDIHLYSSFPTLHKATEFTWKDESAIERHPSEAYHFLKEHFPLLDFEIKKAVYQHHEYMDGSGSPTGVLGRLFSRFSPIVTFANHFIMRTTENPFHKMKHPALILQSMMSRDREKFDDDVLLAYIKGAGMFPLGSWVLLKSGQIGVVVKNNPQSAKTPVVRVVLNAKFEITEPEDINTLESNAKIHSPVPFNEIKKRVPDYKKILLTQK